MITKTTDQLHGQSRQLKSIFGWAFGLGSFLLFSQLAYVPIKGVVFAAGTPALSSAVGDLVAALLAALPAMALLGALWTARQLFKAYADGAILSAGAGRTLGRLGNWLTASAMLALVFGPANDRMDMLTGYFITTQIALICVGLAIRLVGQVQSIAAEIKADHEQIV